MIDAAEELRILADEIDKNEIIVESYEVINGIFEITSNSDGRVVCKETGEVNIYLTLRK